MVPSTAMDETGLTEEDFQALLERANELKLEELFEEPSSYEDELP
jgi:hypothetical protein